MEKGAAILEERFFLGGLWQIAFFSHTAAATQPHGNSHIIHSAAIAIAISSRLWTLDGDSALGPRS